MKRLLAFLLITTIKISHVNAADLNLMGFVNSQMEIKVAEQIHFLGNSEFIIESEDRAGQIERVFLQYNKELSLAKKNIRKVTVYAP